MTGNVTATLPSAEKILIHNSNECKKGAKPKAIKNGSCPNCNTKPDHQSVSVLFICPKDRMTLDHEGKCIVCKKTYEKI